ncbi:MAG: cellulase family glycosylhydrolase [Acidobacteria bacterium]|nr:cellulase family glycosylhydrolase [Acidobacteriota bacterium]
MRQHLFSSTLLAVTFFAFLAVDVHPLPLRGVVLETAQLNIPKTQRDINDVANYGANLVRFPIYFSTPCDLNCWVYFADQAYETASNRGMVMVLDFHHPSEVPGSTITDVDQFVAKWEAFARHFGSRANRPTRILYELCNEPNDRVDWPAVALRAARKFENMIHVQLSFIPRKVIRPAPPRRLRLSRSHLSRTKS